MLNLVYEGMYVCVHVHVYVCKYVYTCIVTANNFLVLHVKINPILYMVLFA